MKAKDCSWLVCQRPVATIPVTRVNAIPVPNFKRTGNHGLVLLSLLLVLLLQTSRGGEKNKINVKLTLWLHESIGMLSVLYLWQQTLFFFNQPTSTKNDRDGNRRAHLVRLDLLEAG